MPAVVLLSAAGLLAVFLSGVLFLWLALGPGVPAGTQAHGDPATEPATFLAPDLYRQCLADRQGFRERFEGRTVTVRGTVSWSLPGLHGLSVTLFLEHGADPRRFAQDKVRVLFKDQGGCHYKGFDLRPDPHDPRTFLLPWSPGDVVTVAGKLSVGEDEPGLCYIVDAELSP
jgi:hypothetical protein